MSGSRLSLSSKLSLASFAGIFIVGVIVLNNPELASYQRDKCRLDSDALAAIQINEDRSELPLFDLFKDDGQKITVKDYAGKGVILNFWATWCPPCIRELPELDELRKEFKDHNIEVIAASTDRGGAPVISAFYEKAGIRNLEVVHDPKGKASRALSIRGLPTTLVIDAQGKEVARILGIHSYKSEESKAFFRRCIGHE